MELNKYRKFAKSERITFAYWYWHWRAFNAVARALGCWKFRYLFHDIEKPWLRLFWDYGRVQRFHRTHSNHHLEYKGRKDYEAMVIDWECSRYTKIASPLTAMQEARKKYDEGEVDDREYAKIVRTARMMGLRE